MYRNKENLTESPICGFSRTFDCTPLNHCFKTLEIVREDWGGSDLGV